jgi:hypothetical protein
MRYFVVVLPDLEALRSFVHRLGSVRSEGEVDLENLWLVDGGVKRRWKSGESVDQVVIFATSFRAYVQLPACAILVEGFEPGRSCCVGSLDPF